MYRIVGSDGKEYGPVDAEQIRRWLVEGRVNARSMVLPEGTVDWKPLGDLPEFGAVTQSQSFSPSSGSSGSASSATAAAEQVKGPAIGLIVTAALGFVAQALSFVLNILGMSMNLGGSSSSQMANFFSGTFGIVFNVIGIAIGVVILLGALKMKRLQSHNFAMASSILALVPCISPCCLVGLPVGIWALVVLAKPEVKGAFR